MVQVEVNNMYINIGANNGSEKYEQKKNTATSGKLIKAVYALYVDRGGTVVKVLYYKSEGRWFYSRWCHWNFSLT